VDEVTVVAVATIKPEHEERALAAPSRRNRPAFTGL
jgi:hypothetical protein